MSKNQQTIILDTPQIDWLTLTSWELTSWQFWREMLDESPDIDLLTEEDPKQLMQYSGLEYGGSYGTAYLGSAFIKSREHIMLRLSGELAHRLFKRAAKNPMREGWAKCTRIDFQITSMPPETWDQNLFFQEIYSPYRKVSFISSYDKKLRRSLATVYIGARISKSITRVYEKALDNRKVALRCEMELKGDYADLACKEVVKEPTKIASYLLGELQHIGDELLELIYAKHLVASPDRVSVKRVATADKTKDWLLGVVIKSLDKYLASHDHDGEALYMFMALLLSHRDKYRPKE